MDIRKLSSRSVNSLDDIEGPWKEEGNRLEGQAKKMVDIIDDP